MTDDIMSMVLRGQTMSDPRAKKRPKRCRHERVKDPVLECKDCGMHYNFAKGRWEH